MATSVPPKLFISYTHESAQHCDKILALADRLRADGIDAELDQYESAPSDGWAHWMGKKIKEAEFVLVICTETYKRQAEGDEKHGGGRCGDREILVIDQEIYNSNGRNEKFIPAVVSEPDRAFVPDFLGRYQIESTETESGYEKLYRRLTNQPGVIRPVLERLRSLPSRQRKTTFHDRAQMSNEPVFDSVKIEPRLERAKAALKADEVFASEILAELEAEGHLDPRITVLRMQIDVAVKQKKVQQLLESARARMEQDEVALALDKLRNALELDPQNPDALAMREAMEKQRHETQIAKWLELAHTHLGNRDFSAARNAVKEVLTIRAGDRRALDLLEQIESTEADARRIREQKELLYSSAIKAYQNGEIETALHKLERLFSVARANPSAAVPERDAVYQSFYKEVRSERDIIHSSLEEAQRQFAEKNFAGAMAICRDLLAKYPNDGTFHALKIRIEDAKRQELSSYIAEISKRVETEPDLDRRSNILREACERFPNEVQFAQQLKTVRERRGLVNSIVAKARQYEERGQYAEAISQWDILRNIHPQYPGIGIELEQCRKKRDRQARKEEEARLVDEIDALIESRAYAKAIECTDAALRDFPGDPELSGLRTLAEQAQDRTKDSRRLFEEGQRAIEEKDLIRGTDLLRGSFHLDPRGPGLRDALVNVLVERARKVVDDNWREAEPLYEEACELDSSHTAVRGLRSTISEAKRQSFVGQCLSECRALVAEGKPQEASERIRTARAEYTSDPRLEQYEASLQKEVNEARRREERGRDRVALGENRRVLEQNPDRARMAAVLEQSYAIRARHPDDAEIGQTVAEIELTAKRVAKVHDINELLPMPTVMSGIDGPAGSTVKAAPESPVEKKGPKLLDPRADKTKLFGPPKPILGSFRISIAHPRTLSKGFNSKIVVVLYLSEEQKQVRQVLERDFGNDVRNAPERYTETTDTTTIKPQTQVQVDLLSQAIEFSQTVSLELSEPLNCARFLAKPREDCRIGHHEIKVVIRDCSTASERYSGFIQVKIVDYLFDHVSRPFFSKCTSLVLTAGSFITFLLTMLGKLDQTLGLTSGTTALLLGSALFGNLFKGYISHRQSLPSP
jgi:hypothetical protein